MKEILINIKNEDELLKIFNTDTITIDDLINKLLDYKVEIGILEEKLNEKI